jgi:hypothetical protein
MKNKDIQVQQTAEKYIQPSHNMVGQPAHVVQDGWIAYFSLPSYQHARASNEKEGRGFFRGHSSIHQQGKKNSF